jgi:BolA protein
MSAKRIIEMIESKMKNLLAAEQVLIVDDSWQHAGHGASGGHFTLTVVSPRFEGVSRLDRNRLVHHALKEEMGKEIHALILRTLTPAEDAAAQ